MRYTRSVRKKGLRLTQKGPKAALFRSVHTAQRGGAAPTAPTNFKLMANDSISATFTWEPGSATDATHFYFIVKATPTSTPIEYAVDGTPFDRTKLVNTASAYITSNLPGTNGTTQRGFYQNNIISFPLTPGTSYSSIQLVAYNTSGNAPSNQISVTTPPVQKIYQSLRCGNKRASDGYLWPNAPGYRDGGKTDSLFRAPYGIAADQNNIVYVCDTDNGHIRKIDLEGNSSTFITGSLNDCQTLCRPFCITFSYGSTWPMYVGMAANDSSNFPIPSSITFLIKKITSAGVVTPAFTARSPSNLLVDYINGITVDKDNNIYAVSQQRSCVYKINSAGVISIFAGSTLSSTVFSGTTKPAGVSGSTDGTLSAARFDSPESITYDAVLNCLYIVDRTDNLIRKITLGATPMVSTLAGLRKTDMMNNIYYANGMGSMTYNSPGARGVVTDLDGNLYVADGVKSSIRKITPAGFQTDYMSQTASNFVGYVVEGWVLLRNSAPTGANPTTIDSTSTGKLMGPSAMCRGKYGMMFYSDVVSNCIMCIAPYPSPPTTITAINIGAITGNSVTITWTGGTYAAEYSFVVTPTSPNIVLPTGPFTSNSATIRGLLDCTSYTVAVVAVNGLGTTTSPTSSSFFTPIDTSAILTAIPNAFSLSTPGTSILGISLSWTGFTRVTTLSYTLTPRNGTAVTATMPSGQRSPFLINTGLIPNTTYSVTLTGTVSPYTGGPAGGDTFTTPVVSVTLSEPRPLYMKTVAGVKDGGYNVATNATATPTTNLLATQLNTVRGIAQDLNGNVYIGARTCILKLSRPGAAKDLYIYDTTERDPTPILVPNAPTALFPGATISLFAGSTVAGVASPAAADIPTGTQTGAAIRFGNIGEIIYSPSQNCLYVSDMDYNVVLRVTLEATPTSTVVAGKPALNEGSDIDGPLGTNTLSFPKGMALDPDGSLYINSFNSAKVRKLSPSGALSTVSPWGPRDQHPAGMLRTSDGSLYVTSTFSNAIQKLTPVAATPGTFTSSVYAGLYSWVNGSTGDGAYADGTLSAARFNSPMGICADSKGNIYVFDAANYAIRLISGPQVYTILGTTPPASGNTDGPASQARVLGQLATGAKSEAAVGALPSANKVNVSLFCDPGDTLYLGDVGNATLRLITPLSETQISHLVTDIELPIKIAAAKQASSALAQTISGSQESSAVEQHASSAVAQAASSAVASSATEIRALSVPVANKDRLVSQFQSIKDELGAYVATFYSPLSAAADKATALSATAGRLADLEAWLSNLASATPPIFAIAPMYQDRAVQFAVSDPYLQSIGSIKVYDAMRKAYITIDSTTGYIIPNVEVPSNRPFISGNRPSGTSSLTLMPTDKVLVGNPTLPSASSWTAYFDSVARRYFYVNAPSGGPQISSYEHPFPPAFSAADQILTDVTTRFLPDGWVKLQSASKNVPYYLNVVTTETLWVHPNPPPDPALSTPASDATLFPTYTKYLTSGSYTSGAQSTVSGIPFYVNTATKEAQWNYPDAAFNVAPSAAQQASSALAQSISGARQSSAVQQTASSAEQQSALSSAVDIKDGIKATLLELQADTAAKLKAVYSSGSSLPNNAALTALEANLVALEQTKGLLLDSAKPIFQLSPTYQDPPLQRILPQYTNSSSGVKRVFDTLRNKYIYLDANGSIIATPVLSYVAATISGAR